jgi:hypothetical protein
MTADLAQRGPTTHQISSSQQRHRTLRIVTRPRFSERKRR